MKQFFKEFKVFMMKGNVLNLAVAVIIGAAFGKIIASLVKDVLMPIISLITGGQGFINYKYVITPADDLSGVAENAIRYGLFVQNIIDFVIIAFVVYLIVRAMTKIQTIANQKEIEAARIEKETQAIILKEKEAIDAQKPKVEDLLLEIKVLLEKNLKV